MLVDIKKKSLLQRYDIFIGIIYVKDRLTLTIKGFLKNLINKQMEELKDLIKFLKDKGLEHQKINVYVLCGIIEYFASKKETKKCDISVVSHCADELEPITNRYMVCAF